MNLSDSQFAVTVASILTLLALVSGYIAAKVTAPKEVDCQVVVKSDVRVTHIRLTRCKV